jgi:hypothetical protein
VISRQALVVTGLAIWLAGICATFAILWRYKLTPGQAPDAPEHWPLVSAIHPAAGLANVVFVAHPRCPCTTASMAELVRLADEVHGRAEIHVVIVKPDGTEPDFEQGAILDRARSIAGADVIVDVGGKEAERFGAVVSGSTIVYGADGTLLFRGGLTTARGHEGRGPAHDRILALLDRRATDLATAPTFGCALVDN